MTNEEIVAFAERIRIEVSKANKGKPVGIILAIAVDGVLKYTTNMPDSDRILILYKIAKDTPPDERMVLQ